MHHFLVHLTFLCDESQHLIKGFFDPKKHTGDTKKYAQNIILFKTCNFNQNINL